jgi:membrane-associated phospholipid phosphatase
VSTKPLFTGHDALVGGAFVVATVGLTQLDKRIAEHVADLRTSSNSDFYQSRADEIKLVNERSLFAVSAGSYVVGRLGHLERLADFGLHASEAIVVAAGVATVFKSGLGRSRPALSQRTTGEFDPFDFKPGKGWSDPAYRSFPSLHEAGTLAFATVFTSEAKRWWPRATPVLAPVVYTVAILPGLARMYNQNHWASDVAMGAGIGIFSGTKVVRYTHSHPHNRIDRLLLSTTIAPAGDGAAVTVHRSF